MTESHPQIDHDQYADRQRQIEESVLTELLEDVDCGAVSLTEAEIMYYDWLSKFHQD